jgi:hypothetical protein
VSISQVLTYPPILTSPSKGIEAHQASAVTLSGIPQQNCCILLESRQYLGLLKLCLFLPNLVIVFKSFGLLKMKSGPPLLLATEALEML